MKHEMTIPQIQSLFNNNFKMNSNHRDITNDIKKLEELGFDINKIDLKGLSKKYKINKTIFEISLNDQEMELIKELFDEYTNNTYILQSIFEKFSYIANIDLENILQSKSIEKNTELYAKSKKNIQKAIRERKKITFEYQPINKTELSIHAGYPYKIIKDEKKIERLLLLNDYNDYVEINLDRIMSEPLILYNLPSNNCFPEFKKAVFKLFYPASKAYHKIASEKIIDIDEEKETITIETQYFSVFRLIQKIIKYGDKAEIISPKEARDEMQKQLSNALKRYKTQKQLI